MLSLGNVLEIHSSIMCSSPQIGNHSDAINRRMDKSVVVYSHSNEKESQPYTAKSVALTTM